MHGLCTKSVLGRMAAYRFNAAVVMLHGMRHDGKTTIKSWTTRKAVSKCTIGLHGEIPVSRQITRQGASPVHLRLLTDPRLKPA
mmetsp:Transcript_21250/g.41244  ORF Transcript_21250/g.41244 Transcript_21250/m.41244 type:complete len:84 (-) Transcript_21250:54-305(-)